MRLESRRPFGTKSSSSQIPEKHITNDTYIYLDAPCMVYMYLHLGDFCRKGWYIFHNYMEHMGSSSTRIPSLFLLVKPLPPWLVQSPVPSQLENHAHPRKKAHPLARCFLPDPMGDPLWKITGPWWLLRQGCIMHLWDTRPGKHTKSELENPPIL